MKKMNEIKVFLLQGGIEVVAEMESVEGTSMRYTLHRPHKLVAVPLPMQTPQGVACQFLMQMVPLLNSTVVREITINLLSLMCEPMNPTPQVRDMYLQISTGIQIAH